MALDPLDLLLSLSQRHPVASMVTNSVFIAVKFSLVCPVLSHSLQRLLGFVLGLIHIPPQVTDLILKIGIRNFELRDHRLSLLGLLLGSSQLVLDIVQAVLH